VIILLSYPLTKKMPLYPNTVAPVINSLRSMDLGDSANTSEITFSTHSGTHVDAPRHFCKKGKTIADCLSIDTTFFPVYCFDIPKPEGDEIGVDDLTDKISVANDAEAILIKTGWQNIRKVDPERYSNDHPWVSPEIPVFLREECPGIRLFGIDQISISSVLHREQGHECHQRFLCLKSPILILEDLNIPDIQFIKAFRMNVYPFFIDAIDGVPVTVIAEM
jgi:arylformamidase